ncbi:putative mitochondrial carrier [Neolecta irregularis DAH-3]|uniref:Putative mitochondrial carrier n=1 Tax=Neolecta irregularis (strain DAH-3) TaxID=1198029 RepID=A0A1U7LT37_NEOID|nr:putative mitochondrial carrier [Neolecta irregularis DAH-3]|eukprot:OLL25778.1 putative mitochondrial carrier [Neolecta irregularis DAH-3]
MINFSPAAEQAIAGLAAGAASTLCMHPLDLIKTRMQVQTASSSRYSSVISSLREHMRQGSLIRTLYRGLPLNVVGSAASWGIYFMWYTIRMVVTSTNLERYDQFKRFYLSRKMNLHSGDYFIASGLAGSATAICTNPLWVVKTRILTSDRGAKGAYDGLIDGLLKISKTEGIKGLYRGLVPSLFGVPHGAFQFLAYEKLKEWSLRRKRKLESSQAMVANSKRSRVADDQTNTEFILYSAVSKIFASVVTYPYQVVRSRLQVSSNSTYTPRSITANTWKSEGLPGFYRGHIDFDWITLTCRIFAQILRTLPGTCITFLVYENIIKYFRTKSYTR